MKISRKPKARYVAFVASSLDGRISLTRNALPDWTSKEDWDFLQKRLSGFDAVVVGRNTYEAAAEHLRKRNTFVLSSRPDTMTRRGSVTFVNPEKSDLREILAGYGNVAVLGGSRVYNFMTENGLIDEIYATIEPLLFGRGVMMLSGGRQTIRLELLSVKRLNKPGSLLLRYKVVK